MGSREQPDPAANSAVLTSSTYAKKLGTVAVEAGPGLGPWPCASLHAA